MHQVFNAKGDIYRELDARIFLLKAYFELRLKGEIEFEELTELVRQGDLSACESLIAQHPLLADELRELVSTLATLANWKTHRS